MARVAMFSSLVKLAQLTLVLALPLAAACSGATTQDVLATSNDSAAGGNATVPGTGDDTSKPDGSTNVDSGATTRDASTPPQPTGCQAESEPNDTPEEANEAAPSNCGKISPAGDVDYLTFELDPSTTNFAIKFNGKVTLTVSVNGKSYVLDASNNPKIPMVKGKPYLIAIRAAGNGSNIAWRVDIEES
ncbi:hypothetical protein AKJ09_04794 [Labilithrix luteola]|uniref:Lipoprotein n=1 Tax=Labilithrix luteola TaxID=1391654 RepID=A0A0K1PX69_9BACT|nr:hypothetical protein [Labilithrix luteola]AKU98130.1 hypothetical protein AKJ09_04794 [Labilithrix luteola]